MAKKKSKTKLVKPAAIEPDHVNQAVSAPAPAIIPLNVCRLCETHDGPFLDIFDGEKNTAKIIENLMPFDISEKDELPQKICFRCSAKVEEFNEFVQKCIKTLENFCTALGKKRPLINKVKTHRLLWEERLNKSNTTNEVICDAVIKKAMEGLSVKFPIREEPLSVQRPSDTLVNAENNSYVMSDVPSSDKAPNVAKTNDSLKTGAITEKTGPKAKKKNTEDIPKKGNLKALLTEDDKLEKRHLRSTRSSNNETTVDQTKSTSLTNNEATNKQHKPSRFSNNETRLEPVRTTRLSINDLKFDTPEKPVKNKQLNSEHTTDFSSSSDKTPKEAIKKNNNEDNSQKIKKPEDKPFNIMDHVCIIKVNGVGVLFQCQLCNRNFLKKDKVLTHGCAKNGVAKEDLTKTTPPQHVEVPRVPTVKYIYTKTNDTNEINNQLTPNKNEETRNDSAVIKSVEDKKSSKVSLSSVPEKKPKPKIGPASRVKRLNDNSEITEPPKDPSPPPVRNTPSHSVVQCPSTPSLGCQYKLLPGPNNTFTLVEAPSSTNDEEDKSKKNKQKKRKVENEDDMTLVDNKQRKSANNAQPIINQARANAETNVQDNADHTSTPYPVGLIQSVPRPKNPPSIVPFGTTAQKKQSYSVVPTGNPSKILILAKPGQSKTESPKKRQKDTKDDSVPNQPYSVTMEDATHPVDPGFFTFINVDPLLEPSYVLPTDNMLQEPMPAHKARNAQKPYSCNMCNLKFTSEKKLLVHIHAHYNNEEETDSTKTARKRRN